MNVSTLTEKKVFEELLYNPYWSQTFHITNKLFEGTSKFQKILIFENEFFGKILALDNIIQTTENDEFIYHEMLAHIPIISHGNVKKVLIIGGGDGGMLRETLRHTNIEKVVMVEIDEMVVEACKKYMPSLFNKAYENPKAQIITDDGIHYIKNTKEKFDVIIIDSTDPKGPGMILFTEQFYSYCKKALNKDGILVTQNGVPFTQEDELINTNKTRSKYFKDNRYFLAPVFSYIGGFMAFGWATDCCSHFNTSIETIKKALKNIDGKMRYYTPDIHKASFILPQYILNKLKQ